jgi:hypothetical protein
MALFGFLRRDRTLAHTVQALDTRLAVLEAAQHPARLQEWHELREQLARYLSRITVVEARAAARQERDSAPNADPITRAVLRSKFPQSNGG